MKRNKFSLSNTHLLTCDMGQIIPVYWNEVLPGDTFQQRTSLLLRVAPLLSPVMHKVVCRIHHWYVPLRQIWEDSEDFFTGGEDGTSTPEPPYYELGSVSAGTLNDYLGVPPGTYSPDLKFSVLPHRAYTKIFNAHYRDQDLVTEVAMSVASGSDSTTPTNTVRNCSWEKDYFTTARPWEMKGDDVTIPLGDQAPVYGIGKSTTNWTTGPSSFYETDGSASRAYANYTTIDPSNADKTYGVEEDPDNSGYPNIRADLSAATGIPIQDLQLALAVQRFQEARAKYGSRYVEYLRHLGVRSSDGRIQNPEYLGGGRQVIQFSEVLQTGEGSDYVGTLRGHGIAALRTNRYRRFFEEHGIVMTLLSVLPRTIYTQGLRRAFSREVKEDYFQKEFQFIGEQEILNKEVYAAHASPDDVFGYQARYDEYRYMPSKVSADFHSLKDHWHYARIFSSDPALNSTFVTASPSRRVQADTDEESLQIYANNSVQARRIMSIAGGSRLR